MNRGLTVGFLYYVYIVIVEDLWQFQVIRYDSVVRQKRKISLLIGPPLFEGKVLQDPKILCWKVYLFVASLNGFS